MWQYRILQTGFFHADGGAMFGAIPKRAWSRKYPADDDNCCILAMNCLLIWKDEKVVLLDTGAGTKDLGKLSYYKFYGTQNIANLVRQQGFEAGQVTDVILSHLHFDHCGGCTSKDEAGNLKITFPNARHWVGKSQWENYLHAHRLEQSSYRKEDVLPLSEAGLLQTVETTAALAGDLVLYLYQGHTAGQLVSAFKAEEGWCLFAGDVIPTKAHLSDEWISAYDTQPLQSLEEKIRLKQQAGECKARMFFYHDNYYSSIKY
ncbi:MAG: putative quorum-quenching lactonase YtnP [Candidatus Ordinivivax streblomastigis]|uniref:Putative quorum-quenching lactonase YtnP n=1 Tax=Candidatus Ordinivivax streblomastigis TaxID=2540710 RepID=A0A5M8NZ47_9BACT|nr:MAG: putative quorum-quenching lactonase YtnP [Candidatus Ordinivivax streblomastigis]